MGEEKVYADKWEKTEASGSIQSERDPEVSHVRRARSREAQL